MYLDTCHYTQKEKPRTCILLRTSYHEQGKVKHKTVKHKTIAILGSAHYQTIPTPIPMGQKLLQALGVVLPEALPSQDFTVATRKSLVPRT